MDIRTKTRRLASALLATALGLGFLVNTAPVAQAAQTQVGSWDFEHGSADPWILRNDSGQAEMSVTEGAGSSAHAVTISNRATTGDGVLIYVNGANDFTIEPGRTVYFDADAKFADGHSGYLNLSSQHAWDFSNVIYGMPVGGDWTHISGSFVMPYWYDGSPATLYLETPWAEAGGDTTAFSIDNVRLSVGDPGMEPGTVFGEWNFDDGTLQDWTQRIRPDHPEDAVVAVIEPGAEGTPHAISITNRANQGDGPLIYVNGQNGFTIPSGQLVLFEAYARFDDGGSGLLNLSSQHGEHNFSNVIYQMPVGTDWTRISGTFNMPQYSEGEIATLYVETPWVPEGTGNTDSFSIDQIRLSVPVPEPTPAAVATVFEEDIRPLTDASFEWIGWHNMPANQLHNNAGWFQLRYTPNYLTVLAHVNAPANSLHLVYDNHEVTVNSDGSGSDHVIGGATTQAETVVQPTADGGFQAIVQIPHSVSNPPVGSAARLSVTALNNDAVVGSWVEEGDVAEIVFAQPMAFTMAREADVSPVIDGEVDPVWAEAQTFNVNTLAQGLSFSTAVGRTLWHGDTLYVLVEVTDDNIHTEAENWWYRDSVTIYLDLGNAKAGYYRPDSDVQISVNADGEVNFGGNGIGYNFADRVQAAAVRTDVGYNVEVAIRLEAMNGQMLGGAGTFHGFDVQVYDNDAPGADSPRVGIQVWGDPSGDAWQNTSRWGVVELVSAQAEAPAPTPAATPDVTPAPMPEVPVEGNHLGWLLPLLLGLAALGALTWWLLRNSARNKARLAAQQAVIVEEDRR